MIRKYKNAYRFQNENKFSYAHSGFGWSFVGRLEQREFDGVVSWSFVFANCATQDTAANHWIYDELSRLNAA